MWTIFWCSSMLFCCLNDWRTRARNVPRWTIHAPWARWLTKKAGCFPPKVLIWTPNCHSEGQGPLQCLLSKPLLFVVVSCQSFRRSAWTTGGHENRLSSWPFFSTGCFVVPLMWDAEGTILKVVWSCPATRDCARTHVLGHFVVDTRARRQYLLCWGDWGETGVCCGHFFDILIRVLCSLHVEDLGWTDEPPQCQNPKTTTPSFLLLLAAFLCLF